MLRAFALVALLLMITSQQAEANKFTFNSETDKVVVDLDKSEHTSFTVTPWKCILMDEDGENRMIVYYDRQGTPKAVGRFGDNGEYFFTVYALEGKYCSVYHARAEINDDGELVKTVAKETNQRSGRIITYTNKKLPGTLRHNTTTHVDSHGNWIFAGDAWKKGLVREMYYYDDGYDKKEDAAVDEVIRNSLQQYKTDTVSSYVTGIPVMIVGLIIKFVWLLLVIYLILLLFKRELAYRPFNRYAGRRVTPYGLFSKTQLHGIIPVALLYVPSLVMLGTVIKAEWNSDVLQWSFVMLISLALSVGYCCLFVKRKSAEIGRKTATAIIAFAVWSVLALVAVIAIAVVAIWVAIVLVFLFAGLSSAIGGFIRGASSVGASSAGLMGGGADGANNDYEPMLDPSNGDDGGVLEGTSRVPLRDNGDGTMTDNQGRLYAKDGDRVRRL